MTAQRDAGRRATGRFDEIAVVKASAVEQPAAGAAWPVLLIVTVFGKPVTQGSKTRTKWGIRDDNADRLRPWREAVKQASLDALAGADRIEGPVVVDVVFTFDRPKSAPKSRPCWPVTRSSGDLDKLQRALFDALTDAGCGGTTRRWWRCGRGRCTSGTTGRCGSRALW